MRIQTKLDIIYTAISSESTTRAAVVEIVTRVEIYGNCFFFYKSKVLYIYYCCSHPIYLNKNDGNICFNKS